MRSSGVVDSGNQNMPRDAWASGALTGRSSSRVDERDRPIGVGGPLMASRLLRLTSTDRPTGFLCLSKSHREAILAQKMVDGLREAQHPRKRETLGTQNGRGRTLQSPTMPRIDSSKGTAQERFASSIAVASAPYRSIGFARRPQRRRHSSAGRKAAPMAPAAAGKVAE
eukprot:scaffold1954_cov268-Pinguiococcus_pyrenoidosus.AAC.133